MGSQDWSCSVQRNRFTLHIPSCHPGSLSLLRASSPRKPEQREVREGFALQGPTQASSLPTISGFTAALARASTRPRALLAKRDFLLNLKVGCVPYFI